MSLILRYRFFLFSFEKRLLQVSFQITDRQVHSPMLQDRRFEQWDLQLRNRFPDRLPHLLVDVVLLPQDAEVQEKESKRNAGHILLGRRPRIRVLVIVTGLRHGVRLVAGRLTDRRMGSCHCVTGLTFHLVKASDCVNLTGSSCCSVPL